MRSIVLILLFIFSFSICEGTLPKLTPEATGAKLKEILEVHAVYKQLTPELVERAFQNYLELLDPTKTYFIESDIQQWLKPSDTLVQQTLVDYDNNDFREFEKIHQVMIQAIKRRKDLEKEIDVDQLPQGVDPTEFKDMNWVTNQEQLLTRLKRIRGLQVETAAKLNEELKGRSLQRILKRQKNYEDDLLNSDPIDHQHLLLSNVLKATSSALDAHTAYFTPDEATQFMISVQQRLFGIGAQLRDDLNGLTITKILEGGPAAAGGLLKVNDRIIAVDGEPIVGMDIIDAVDMIRGPEGTKLSLTVIRKVGEGDNKEEKTLEVNIERGEVVLKDTRYEISHEPFGDGIIAHLHLYSFYQDEDSSSSADLARELNKLKAEHRVKGVILDLRNNSGGLLSQAVGVTGLFITKGIVVSIKDNAGHVRHLRDLDSKTVWDGPLIVLINRASASASEIVAQTLQDYGRAIIVGDDHSFGKGSFQTFTLNAEQSSQVSPEGEYKVTRGRYYTVSGKTPQLTGVVSDIVIPGPFSVADVGEKYSKYPLKNDQIEASFDDDLSDIPFAQRNKVRMLYKFDLQPRLEVYNANLHKLQTNSKRRIESNKNYQSFLEELEKKNSDASEATFGKNDLQLDEAFLVMKDLIHLMQ